MVDERNDRTELDEQTTALRTGAGGFVPSRAVLAVRGPEAESYLQGQVSQDVVQLGVGESVDSLLLRPDGKLVALVRVTRVDGQTFVLDTDGGLGEAVAERLLKFRLRSKFELEHLDWRCLSLRGAAVEGEAAGLLAVLGEGGVLALPFEWNGWRGTDLLGPKDVVLDASELPAPIVRCGAEAVEACRIASGIPAMGAELTEKTIPAEAGLVGRTVDFDKGCYTGQELVARIDARGSNVQRRLVGVVGAVGADGADGADGSGDPVRLSAGMTLHADPAPPGDSAAEDKILGTITSAAWSSELGSWIALAYLHRSVPAPGPVRVRSGDGVGGSLPARVANLPLVGGEG